MDKYINFLHDLGFDRTKLNSLAIENKFIERIRKLDGLDYLLALLHNVTKEVVSFNTMASTFVDDIDKCVTKQALHKAMSKEFFIVFIDKIFNELLQTKLGIANSKLKSKFRRIVIQDSSIIKLPQRLYEFFSGVKNNFSQVANARVQVALDILTNTFTLFSIDSYSINDKSAAHKLQINNGDLIIRDRGYCTIAEMLRILAHKADFIYRYYHVFKYYNVNTGKVIDVYKLVKNKKKLKAKVRIGSPDGVIVTLCADKVSDAIANERRRQLKKSSSGTPSNVLLQLLSWSIYFTSIDDDEITSEDIFSLYKLRWRIEIIFKSMKSHLNFDNIHDVSENQLKFILKGKMMWLLVVTQFIYEVISKVVFKKTGKAISLLKLVRYLKDNVNVMAEIMALIKRKIFDASDTIDILTKYCCYDTRYDRKTITSK